jgi:hypothetical protein
VAGAWACAWLSFRALKSKFPGVWCLIIIGTEGWVVERTLAWLNRCRRLAKDFENLSRTALAFLQLASIRLMLRKLCNPI